MNNEDSLWQACDPRGRTGRGAYAVIGLTLTAMKLLLDRAIVYFAEVDYWNWIYYWRPLAAWFKGEVSSMPEWLTTLLLFSLPFIAIGVALTLRRLRDAAAPLWLVVLFFVPVLNLILFTVLCLMPPRDHPRTEIAPRRGFFGWLARTFALESTAVSAAMAIVLTALIVTPLTWLATVIFKDYGWSVFVGIPFMLGLVAAVVHGAARPRTLSGSLGVAFLALIFSTGALLAFAIEGVICLIMAAPLATPIVMIGAIAGYYLQLAQWSRVEQAGNIYMSGWIALPLAMLGEAAQRPEPPLLSATTCVEISASPGAVWRQVVAFSELAPPEELIFRSGIAYPIRATIQGSGVGAVRRCEFSTGPFVEPITVWDENRRLAFDVIEQPHPMHELSPYRALDTAHLEGFFLSQRGEFRLIALPGGGTRLEGTTWYTQRFWPASYWQVWSDYLLHSIHHRVLEHIRVQAEASERPAPPVLTGASTPR